MTHAEIETCQRQLTEILQKRREDGKYKPEVRGDLRGLADKIGASTQTVFIDIIQGGHRVVRDAEECELAYNIHQSLQTASMIDACTTAAKNYEIAPKAQENARRSTVDFGRGDAGSRRQCRGGLDGGNEVVVWETSEL